MKRAFTLICLVYAMNIFGLQNWRVYTNSTYIYDMEIIGERAYLATWGGLEIYDFSSQSFINKLTTINGLSENEIRSIDFYNGNQLLLGTYGGGIDRYDFSDFLMPLDEILGVASNYVYDIVHQDSLIFVISKKGLSVFLDDPDFPFPLLVSNYNANNGPSFDELTSIELTSEYLLCGSIVGLDYVHLDSLSMPTAWHHLNADNSLLPSSNVTSISAREGKIAVATDNGLLIMKNMFDPAQMELVAAGMPVYPVQIDVDLNVWFSYGIWDLNRLILSDTMNTAVTRLAEDGSIQEWQVSENGLRTNKVKAFYDFPGNMIVLSWGEGVFLLNPVAIDGRSSAGMNRRTDWATNLKSNCLSANLIADLEIDQNQKLWVATGYFGLEQLGKGTKGVCSFDGAVWEHFNKANYPGLKNDNVLDIAIDSSNRKWFSSWQYITGGNGGISILDEELDQLYSLTGFPTNYCTGLAAAGDQMWVSRIGGVAVMNTEPAISHSYTFQPPFDPNHKIMISFHGENYSFFGTYDKGVQLWNDDSAPLTIGSAWVYPPSTQLRSGTVYDFASRRANGIEEIWIASGMGLFKYDGSDWFWYGTNVKMKVWQNNMWFWNENNPDPTYWYYVGQERLYGSISTYPTALFVDPFGLVWIGTAEAGITIFDVKKDKFTNLTVANSPLISNSITSFAYEKYTGTLYIGTTEGLNSVQIGISHDYNIEEKLHKTVAFPNPFYPEKGEIIRIENIGSYTMPAGETRCFIYDLNGELIVKLNKNIHQQFSWDGTNSSGKKCSSGMYIYLVTAPDGQTSRGKIALIR